MMRYLIDQGDNETLKMMAKEVFPRAYFGDNPKLINYFIKKAPAEALMNLAQYTFIDNQFSSGQAEYLIKRLLITHVGALISYDEVAKVINEMLARPVFARDTRLLERTKGRGVTLENLKSIGKDCT